MNESATCVGVDAELTQRCSADVPHRYRLITPDGDRSPPFRPKPGELGRLLSSAFPGQNEFELVEA